MEINVKKTYEVVVKRTIKEGVNCRISPSYGCLDILPGIVEIVKVGTQDEINDPSYDFESWESNDSSGLWVQYKYNDNHIDILPFEEFIDHTSIV